MWWKRTVLTVEVLSFHFRSRAVDSRDMVSWDTGLLNTWLLSVSIRLTRCVLQIGSFSHSVEFLMFPWRDWLWQQQERLHPGWRFTTRRRTWSWMSGRSVHFWTFFSLFLFQFHLFKKKKTNEKTRGWTSVCKLSEIFFFFGSIGAGRIETTRPEESGGGKDLSSDDGRYLGQRKSEMKIPEG